MNNNYYLLQNLYSLASGKYLKFKVRFDKAIHSGRFYKLSKRKQSTLISRLKRLYERLKSLQTQLRIAGAGAALAVTLSVSNPVHAQSSLGPFEINDIANPFPPPFNFLSPRPAVVDIDNDGDLDVFVGTQNGAIEFFRNNANVSGPKSVRRFTQITGASNPLENVNEGYSAEPAFTDVDNDGDFDMLLGTGYGYTFFFRNIGSKTNPVFEEQTGTNNPFSGITGTIAFDKYGYISRARAIPVFIDMDGDADGNDDQDLFIGSSYLNDYFSGPQNAVQYFENNTGIFTGQPSSLASELGDLNNVSIAFADIDGDLDLDAIVGTYLSAIKSFRQDPGLTFTEVFGGENPFSGINFDSPSPAAADLDGDLDLDFLVGTDNIFTFGPDKSNLQYFENTDAAFTLKDRTDLNTSPFGGVDVGSEAAPVFTDLDGDGDSDAVIGSKYADQFLFVYENENGLFTADPDHPLVHATDAIDPFIFVSDVIPVFVDIDNDADQDLFISADSYIHFFRNSSGNFNLEPTLFPTLNSPNARELSLAFVDVDNDEDFDALMGNSRYGQPRILYFQNDGTASAPNFISSTPPAPFNTPIFDSNPNLVATDLDNDGDTDISLSESYYVQSGYDPQHTHVRFFENNSDGTFTEESSPIIADGSPQYSYTSFADLDGDGDLDGFLGNGDRRENGQVTFFENTNPPPVTNVNSLTLGAISGEPIIVDPLLTITDPDNDDISVAIISISDFVVGEEELGFTEVTGIVGEFDADEGVLTFIGRAPIATYQTLLRSVTFNYTGDNPGGRRSNSGRIKDLLQDITFEVLDADFTLTTVSVVSLNIVPAGAATEIEIYNAVSPNKDDNANGYFRIRYIETVSPENKVTIYNRWGDIVYEVSGYNNDTKLFDGTSDKGKELPSGTYFYKIETNSKKTFTGYLSLKR